jgi:hypothetical protein
MENPGYVRSLAPQPLVSGPIVNQLMPSAYGTTGGGAALIKPPKRSSRTVRVEINSVDRDYGHSPNPANFRWEFPFPVKEVREVRIVGGTVPVPFLNMDAKWNRFTFMDNLTNYTVTLPIGYYTISTLATELQNQLNSLGALNTYTVGLVGSSGQLEIKAVGGARFAFMFGTGEFVDELDPKSLSVLQIGCPARLLGFGRANYENVGDRILAPRLPNLWYPLERAYLYLNFDSSIDLRAVRRGAGRREPSAILYFDELNVYNLPDKDYSTNPFPLTKYLNRETYDSVIEPTPASLSRISYIEVSLRDMFYNPINTQGREMSLLLDLVIVD